MRKFLLLATLFFLFACIKERDTIEDIDDSTYQTTLMYMTGTDLSYYFNQNITAVKLAIADNSLGSGRFFIFKHTSSTSASLIEYRHDNGACTTETLKEYSDIISLTSDALLEVISDVKELAPANSYNLIVSGHATGWIPKELQSSWTKIAAAEGTTTSAVESIDWEAMQNSPIVTRYLGSTNDSFFDISEFKASLDATETHFGYILFDECFMSSIEAIYSLRNNCDYIVASPCEIMGAGFPYDTVIPELFTNGGKEFDLQGACQAFYEYYNSYNYPSGCVAVAVTSQLEELAQITQLINTTYSERVVDTSEVQAYERLANHVFFDLEDYMLAKCGDDAILAAEFTEQMLKAFPIESRLHTERFFANIGVSASSANSYEAYYTTITYYSGVTTSDSNLLLSEDWKQSEWGAAVN